MADTNNTPTFDDLRGAKEFYGTYEANLICSQLRSACSLIENKEDYGSSSVGFGDVSINVSYLMHDAIEKVDKLRLYVDELESGIMHNNGENRFDGSYEVNLLYSLLRATCELVESIEGVSSLSTLSTKLGGAMMDVSYILRDTMEKVDRLRLHVDELESGNVRNSGGTLHENISGGLAGMEALRNIERIAQRIKSRSSNGDGLSMDEWFEIQDDAVGAMHAAAGKQNAFMRGFLATVAEYVMSTQEGGIPDLDKWKPEATMTESEKALSRAKFAEEVFASVA